MLQKQSPKTGAGAATVGMKDKESLEAAAVISETAGFVKDEINLLLPDRIVTSCICEYCKRRVTQDMDTACTYSYSRRPPSL
jgi:hypothetical protein